jgi:hypothetical protein
MKGVDSVELSCRGVSVGRNAVGVYKGSVSKNFNVTTCEGLTRRLLVCQELADSPTSKFSVHKQYFVSNK